MKNIKNKIELDNKNIVKSEKEESNVTITLDNTQEENKIKNILNKEGDENRSGFRKCEF